MRGKKWIPWNWFNKEDAQAAGTAVPVKRAVRQASAHDVGDSLAGFHQDLDRLFDRALRGFNLSPFGLSRPFASPPVDGLIKPTLDLSASDKAYTVTVEVPGIDEKDVEVEIVDDTLTIRGEKQQAKEEKEADYYRMERHYGSFQRVLSLPQDADQDGVAAAFKNGVLKITVPRKMTPPADVRRIDVKAA